ncbi:MAG: MATE family efflux transporter [Clostridium sp.]
MDKLKKKFGEIFNDKRFYRKLLFLSVPIVMQNLITSSLNMLDTMMIGSLGEVELAAVGIANQYYFLFSLIIMGISSGASVFISQLWGKKDKVNIKKTLGIGVMSGILISLVFTFVAVAMPEKIIGIFNTDANVIKIGSEYLVIASISYIFTSITFNYAAASRSVEDTIVPMLGSFVALCLNGILNYALIFGKLGAPALGVSGAAIATVVARVAETIIIIGYIYIKKGILAARLHEMFNVSLSLVKKVYVTITPVLLNEACWGLGNVTYAVIYGRMGTYATASVQICSTVLNLFMIATFGLANASVVVIGKEIGCNNEERGKLYAIRLCATSVIMGVFLAVILAVSAESILSIFKVSNRAYYNSIRILLFYAFVMPIKVYTGIMIVGILRGGGDAKFGTILQGITLWGIGIPLSFIAAFVFNLEVYVVVAITGIEEIIKLIFINRRFKSNKWINNVINDIELSKNMG